MDFKDYLLNLLAGVYGGLISGVILFTYLNLIEQNKTATESIFGAVVLGLILFFLFLFAGWVVLKFVNKNH